MSREGRAVIVGSGPNGLTAAITLAEAEGDLTGSGVLVTGSVITAGHVRSMVRRAGGAR